jgi:hypothetical protein
MCGESKRGKASLFIFFPLSFEGEGDKGGEVDKSPIEASEVKRYTVYGTPFWQSQICHSSK